MENVDPDLVAVEPRGFEVPADWRSLRSPESYLGYGRPGFASPDRGQLGQPFTYSAPSRLSLNEWAPSGTWTLARHAAVLDAPGGQIAFRFQARDVHLVMGPVANGASVPFRVRLDGTAPGASHGLDVDGDGNGRREQQRLYQLIRGAGPGGEHLCVGQRLDAGVEAYCFTFG